MKNRFFSLPVLLVLGSCFSPGALKTNFTAEPTLPDFFIRRFGVENNDDVCNSVTTDADGFIYCAGRTQSDLGEVNGGISDAFVAKFTKKGEVVWITQLGDDTKPSGGSTSNYDECNDIALDSLGNVFCGGSTASSLVDPVGGALDSFVAKFDPDGGLLWVTQLSSSPEIVSNAGAESITSIAVDANDDLVVAGNANGNFGENNATPGTSDGFVAKISSGGAIVWVTQLGNTTTALGGSNASTDELNGVAVDSAGNVYATGTTQGNQGETNGGGVDVVVMRLDAGGNLDWLTQLGDTTEAPGGSNSGFDYGMSIVVDSNGEPTVGGYTTSSMAEPVGGGQDIFMAKFNAITGTIDWLTHYGQTSVLSGSSVAGTDYCYDITVDANDNLYCGGSSTGAFADTNPENDEDGVFIKVSATGVPLFVAQAGATNLPSNVQRGISGDECVGIDIDPDGNVICAGRTNSDFAGGDLNDPDLYLVRFTSTGTF